MNTWEVDVNEVPDWDLVCLFCHWSPPNPESSFPRRIRVAIDRAVWERQDGYGVPGYVPPQGWDWSGIRDSSPQAQRAMADAIRACLKEAGIEKLAVTDADYYDVSASG